MSKNEKEMGWVMACLMGILAIVAIMFALGVAFERQNVETEQQHAAPPACDGCPQEGNCLPGDVCPPGGFCPSVLIEPGNIEIRGPNKTIHLEADR